MWPDNETDVDLLGFDYLVDELEILLTTQRLLPLTVLVSGDWGSGKSSLMEVTRKRLETAEKHKDRFICVRFTPWRFEDFNYGKVALMAAVIDGIIEYAVANKSRMAKVLDIANKLRKTLHRWGLWKQAAVAGATALGAAPLVLAGAAALAQATGDAGATDEEAVAANAFETVAEFHERFEELMEALGDDVQALVVFIDDMDRCSSSDTVVETFEAMRLFMHAPKTAYVVGAHQSIVEAALDARYAARADEDESYGSHWLEKMLQRRVRVPPLGEPDVMSYIHMLFAELHVDKEQFEHLRARADERRKSDPFQVAMNVGIARDVLGELPDELEEALKIADQVGPVLARNLRGNPRETKGFLNDFLLRKETAERRSMDLDPARLCKLMVLERLLDTQHFEQLFRWYLAADTGAPDELKLAEVYARTGSKKSVPASVQNWVNQPKVRDWLKLEPSLVDTNLGPYFAFSRDKLAALITAPQLSLELQDILAKLQNNDVPPIRTNGVTEALKLDDEALGDLLPVSLDAAKADLDSAAGTSLREVAMQKPSVATAMFEMLKAMSAKKVKGTFIGHLAVEFKGDTRLRPLLEHWQEKGSPAVQRNATRALGKL